MSILALALASMLAQQVEQQRDWRAALRTDATAMHQAIATGHPGSVNPDDPGFAARNDAQFARALSRARTADSFAAYFYAMQEYAASFNDGHIAYGVWGATPDKVTRWPGFLTRYDDSGKQHVFVSEPWSGVPVGAQLLSCDGRNAEEVALNRIGSRVGRWKLAAQRQLFGAMTFIDTGNPYVHPTKRCHFRHAGKAIDVSLQWRPPEVNLYERYVFGTSQRADVSWQHLEDGTQWFTIPSFDGNPDSPTGNKLTNLVSYIDTHASEIRAAPAIVFDLRGNGGGSSDWSHQIAVRLWGMGAIVSHPEPPMTISWRASSDNLAAIRGAFAERSRGGNLSAEATAWYRDTIAGLEKAVAAGDALWVIRPSPAQPQGKIEDLPSYRVNGPVYVVTDATCMSACLDAVDLWTRLGAIPIGRETGADTLYMEVRQVRLPAGLGAVSVPMKFYSGRVRGNNEPVVPRHRFEGDLADTMALQKWISTLPELASQRGRSVKSLASEAR
jgi:GNAT superfamily N-acetyltransferase